MYVDFIKVFPFFTRQILSLKCGIHHATQATPVAGPGKLPGRGEDKSPDECAAFALRTVRVNSKT
jgi:hypothetical protein